MGKSQKKKQKSADFQKVKFKVGKKKPVGTNVTDTSFKTSSINIVSQLKKGDEPTNRRNLSLKDLLAQLNHYNTTVRHDALLGLQDLFRTHSDVMHDQLSVWITKVLGKITDTDSAIRHALHTCLVFAFNNLKDHEVSPFLKIIIAHVCCGMTHINTGIQIDSLNILDLILDHFPVEFVPYSNKVLSNFMDLISKQSSKETKATQTLKGSKVKGISSIVNRELSIDVQGKMSSLKARSKILEKLHKILRVLWTNQFHEKVENTNFDTFQKNITISEEKATYVCLYKYAMTPPPTCETDLESWLDFDVVNESAMGYNLTEFRNFIQNVFPILLNCWVEYEPGQLSSGLADSNSLRSSLPGMKAVIDIIDILMQLLCQNTNEADVFLIHQDFFKDFSSHFLHYFALPLHFATTKSTLKSIKQAKPDMLQQFAIDFNFVMARILCIIIIQTDNNSEFNTKYESKLNIRYIKQLVTFVTDILDSNILLSVEKIEELINITKNLFNMKSSCIKGELINCSLILKKILKLYKKASVSSPWKIPLVRFLNHLLSSPQTYLNSISCLKQCREFMQVILSDIWSLPATSRELINESVAFMKMIMVKQIASDKATIVLSNSIVNITEITTGWFLDVSLTTQKLIVETVYSFPELPRELLNNFVYLCHSYKVDMEIRKYIISIIVCCGKKNIPSIKGETLISFLLTVIIGYSTEELQRFNAANPNAISWSILNVIPRDMRDIPVDFAISQFEQFEGYQQLWPILVPAIGRLLMKVRCLPTTAAVGLVKLLEKSAKWWKSDEKDTSEINQIADLVSSILLYSVSATYKSVTPDQELFSSSDQNMLKMEEEVTMCCINLLTTNDELLRLLLKKWIHALGEYKMNTCCVNSIIEVLVALLQDVNMQFVLIDMKPNLYSIVDSFSKMNTIIPEQASLLHQLKIHVSLL